MLARMKLIDVQTVRAAAPIGLTALLFALSSAVAACGPPPVPVDLQGRPLAPGAAQVQARPTMPPRAQMPDDATHAALGEGHSADDGHDHGVPAGHSADDGHNHGPATQAPQAMGHAPTDSSTTASFGGVIRLRGELASATDGFLFVSVMPAGTNSPVAFDRFALSDAALGTVEAGERVIPFSYPPTPIPAGALELKVQYDVDGYVETKDGATRVARFPIGGGEEGDTAIDVVLDGDDPATAGS